MRLEEQLLLAKRAQEKLKLQALLMKNPKLNLPVNVPPIGLTKQHLPHINPPSLVQQPPPVPKNLKANKEVDLVASPIYQKPTVIAHQSQVAGISQEQQILLQQQLHQQKIQQQQLQQQQLQQQQLQQQQLQQQQLKQQQLSQQKSSQQQSSQQLSNQQLSQQQLSSQQQVSYFFSNTD